jgi:O-antigen/teichoic acid export membrane protein
VKKSIEEQAGSAIIWNAIQLFGNKAIFLIRMLILARLLVPEDFGLFVIATSATGFLISLTNMDLIPAVVQAENVDETKYAAVWTFDVTRSIIITSLTIIFAPLIAEIFAQPLAVPIIQVLAVRSLLESLISIKIAAFNRNLSFRPLTYLKLTEAIVNTIISILLAELMGVWALVFGALGGALVMVIVSYILAPYRPRLLFDWRAILPLMNFGGWVLIINLITIAGSYGLRRIGALFHGHAICVHA